MISLKISRRRQQLTSGSSRGAIRFRIRHEYVLRLICAVGQDEHGIEAIAEEERIGRAFFAPNLNAPLESERVAFEQRLQRLERTQIRLFAFYVRVHEQDLLVEIDLLVERVEHLLQPNRLQERLDRVHHGLVEVQSILDKVLADGARAYAQLSLRVALFHRRLARHIWRLMVAQSPARETKVRDRFGPRRLRLLTSQSARVFF